MSWSKFSILLDQLTKPGTTVAIVIVIEKGIIFYPFASRFALRFGLKNYSRRIFSPARGKEGENKTLSGYGGDR